jgi:4-aminobutyrate aminotransferase-like enzyme/Ser/Thr protein kinase RdoA (MazF antagonist)
MSTASDAFIEPAPTLSHQRLRQLLHEQWRLADPHVQILDSERDFNVCVDNRVVLKVSNPAEAADVIDMEVQALAHLATTAPQLPVPRTVPTHTGDPVVWIRDDNDRRCAARLLTLMAGQPLEGKPIDTEMATQVGAIAAQISIALQGFFHPAAGRSLMWDIRRTPAVLERSGITQSELTDLAMRVSTALRATATLPSGIQHADVTLTNVLAQSDTVTAVVDFGDMHHTAAVCDLANTLTSVLRNGDDDLQQFTALTAAVLEGYQRHRSLSAAEVTVLGELVIARLITTLAVSASRRERHRANYNYIVQYDRNSERALHMLAAMNPDELAERLARLAGTRALADVITPSQLPRRRAAAMGGGLSPLFYRRPLEVVRGAGPWLYTRDGKRYLDAYNNVAVIGHAHPAVSTAVHMQLDAVNTHSRYLHAGIVELAERILETMPAPLDTCLFTTSGTEANELAWRMATEFTGGNAAIVAEHAYHGTSKWMAELSSNEWPDGYRPERVATFAAPHAHAGELTAAEARARIKRAADTLRTAGWTPALVLADSQFTSEGVLDPPGSFCTGLVEGAHAAGALYLADEVQSGYGRSGPQLWRFTHDGYRPDIVTLGKPMGAGYPIGCVVTRREIADVLGARYEYFSTFAATAAAAAAGHAVLDIMQTTGLPTQAVEVGMLLRSRLRELAASEPILGSVRGTGLIAGVDVKHCAQAADSRAAARMLLNNLSERGVLAGLTGPGGDVLKVRPPLVWQLRHVEIFINALAESAAALGADR